MQIPPDHPSLAGHFPGRPVVPAVVLLGEVRSALSAQLGRGATIAAIPAAKFHALVAPGEAFQVRFTDAPNGGITFEVRTGDKLCVSGTLILSQP